MRCSLLRFAAGIVVFSLAFFLTKPGALGQTKKRARRSDPVEQSAAREGLRGMTVDMDRFARGSEPFNEAVKRYLNRQEPKIVGGKQAPAGAFPWQVSLGVSWIADPYYAHFCGGSVYSD